MDYLLVLKPGDELLARGNSFTTCLSPCILTPWIQFSADLEAVIVCWFYHKPFDYHLRYLCFQLKLCLHLFWLIWAAKLVVDRKFNIFTFISSKGGRGGGIKKCIIRALGGFEVVYFQPCAPVVTFLFGIGVPGCAGLSFTITPPFPYPSAPLPISSPVLPSPL